MAILRVWIDEGCIVCNACEAECPDVFKVTDETCHITAAVREDGKQDDNLKAKSPLKEAVRGPLAEKIQAAAGSCPVNVIRLEMADAAPQVEPKRVETPKVEAKAEPVPEAAPKPVAAPAPAPAPKPAPVEAKPVTEPEAAPVVPEGPKVPAVYDYKAAPNRQVVLPKTTPLPSYRGHVAEVEAQAKADEAKYQKALADWEVAKVKAAEEGKPEPKAPVKAAPKKEDGDMRYPAPRPAEDADLLKLQAVLGDKVVEIFQQGEECTCHLRPEALLEALRLVHSDPELRYELLSDQTATHYPAGKDFAFSVVYHLTSVSRRKRLRLRILIPEGFEPESATQVYPGANWLEREIFDMLGIRFLHHPDMTRILCPDDWEAHPLRKEYPVVGWGQRDIDFREDRSGMLNKIALQKAGYLGVNLKQPKAE